MISPALLQGAPRQQGLLPEEELIQSPLLAGQMQQQNQQGREGEQTIAANLPALQAAQYKAETQGRGLENEKLAAFLPAYKAALDRNQGTKPGENPDKTGTLPPQYSGIPGLQGGQPLENGQVPKPPSAYDQYKSLISGANDENTQNENAKANSQFLGLPATIKNEKSTALTAAKNAAITDALNDLKTNMQAAGDKPSDINDAILTTETKYPLLVADPDFKEALTNAKLHDPVFNLNTSNVRDMTNLRGISEKNTAPYLNARNFWSQGEKTYADYLKQGGPANPGAKSYQQGILDKFVGVSLQKSPTEAQIKLTQSWPGFQNYLEENKDSQGNFLGYKLKNGVFIPENVLSSMMDVMRDDVKGLADNVKQNNAGVRRMAGSDYNPDKAMIITDEELEKDLGRIPQKMEGSNFTNDPTYKSLDEIPANATGAWVNGVHYSPRKK